MTKVLKFEKQKNSKEKLDQILQAAEMSMDGIAILDRDERYIFLNRSYAEIHGYDSVDDLWEKSWRSLYDEEELEKFEKNILPVLFQEKEWKGEVSSKEQNGEKRSQLLSLSLSEEGGMIWIVRDVTAWKEAKENLEKLNVHDHLTGVYNRIFFEWKLKKVNYGECLPLGVIVCDVDNLQAINHRLGYKKGDEALLAVSRILRHRFRAGDIIARIGGDEFAVLLTDIDDSVIRRKERQIRQGIREYDKNFPEGLFSVSLGCAVSAEVLSDVHRLLNEADTRMHQEKDQKTTINEEASVEVLVRVMKARDYNTGEHCDRLQRLLFLLGGSFELSEEETRNLSLLARFHDLGKVGVPDWVLFKPGPLTPREQEQMRAHCRIGYDIARADPRLAPIAEHILKHHERWGGGGYPLGVIGDDIPLACRLLAVADAYDAMTSDRPYRQALSHETALAELKSNAGTQFDPEAVKRFFLMINSDAFSS